MAVWAPIPGETPIDPSGLKVRGITTRGELAVVEAENIRAAVMKYLAMKPSPQSAPFDVPWLLRLHRDMFDEVWDWAGVVRSEKLNLGLPAHQIREALAALVGDLDAWTELGVDLLAQAARLHHRSVWIHPFQNGNGRWARLLANIWLRRHDAPLVRWPEAAIGGVSPVRDEYIKAIRAADEGEEEPLIDLHARFAEGGRSR